MKQNRIQELEKLILHHKEKYYLGRAEITDEAFDQLEDELKKLDPDNPVLQLVGFVQSDSANKVQHQKKMLSLEKTYAHDDLLKWIKTEDVISIFKIDGSSCSLIYENGHLVLAKTRGDGSWGENITKKSILIPDIPKTIPGKKSCEIRGEIFCIEKNFFQLRTEMNNLGLGSPSSQRNIVAGLLGRKENIQLCRYLSFQAFDIIGNDQFTKEDEKLNNLKEMGFLIPDYILHHGKKEIEQRIEEAKEFMTSGSYLIDGLVFVYNNLKLHNELGETSHHPRYKIAFKFQGETKTAEIIEIEWGVSRNGTLTPVALIDPTELSGAMIGRVTLHNFGLVKNFQLKPGDKIEIIRSGEVIPKFLGVVESSSEPFSYPERCPSCQNKLKVEDIWLYCDNEKCPAKIKEEVLNYVHKAGIDDISDKRLDELMNKGMVKIISDLYRLQKEDFLMLDKVKEKLAKKMFENIQKSKNQTLAQFVSAIGIEGVSIAKSEKIIAHGYNTIEKFQSLTMENLTSIEGFAEKSSETIISSLANKENLINQLLSLGVKVLPDAVVTGEGPLTGLKFCITGELSQPRSYFEKLIKQNGGIVAGVSKNLNYLVTNEVDSNSSKFVKARLLGVPVINEDELLNLIEV